MTVGGADLLVANVGGTLLAYRNACGWCRARLDAAPMTPGGDADVPVVRARASSCAAPGARPTTTRCRSRRCRCCAAKARVRVAVA